MKSIVITRDAGRQTNVSLGLLTAETLALAANLAQPSSGALENAPKVDGAEKLSGTTSEVHGPVAPQSTESAGAVDNSPHPDDAVLSSDEVAGQNSEFGSEGLKSLFQATLKAFQGTDDFQEVDIKRIVRVASVRDAHKKIGEILNENEPFKPTDLESMQDSDKYQTLCTLYTEGKNEEAAALMKELIEEQTAAVMQAALPEKPKAAEELVTPEEKVRQFINLVTAQIKTSQMGAKAQNDIMQWKRIGTTIKENQRVAALSDADLEALIPQKDEQILGMEQLMNNPAFMAAFNGADGDDVDNSGDVDSGVSTPDDVAAEPPASVAAVSPVTDAVGTCAPPSAPVAADKKA